MHKQSHHLAGWDGPTLPRENGTSDWLNPRGEAWPVGWPRDGGRAAKDGRRSWRCMGHSAYRDVVRYSGTPPKGFSAPTKTLPSSTLLS